MTSKPTDKSKYYSKYSQGYCTLAQYIVELVCENKARKEKKDLPIKFWNRPEWSNYFRGQIRAANSLVKKYSSKAILATLEKNHYVYSLRGKWLEPKIKQEENNLIKDVQPAQLQMASTVSQPRPQQSVHNILDLLEE